jgi:hypothetical protein
MKLYCSNLLSEAIPYLVSNPFKVRASIHHLRSKHLTYSKKELKKYLENLLKGKDELANFTFEYLSGHTSFHVRLKIQVTSNKIVHRRIHRGVPVDSAREANEAVVRELEFSDEQLVAFIDEIMNRKIWELENCTERPLPDNALLTFLIRKNDEIIFEREIWEICRNDDPQTKELIRTLSAIIPQEWTPP